MSYPQKGHGKKRPRRFHRGPSAGRQARPALEAIARAEQRGRSSDDTLRSVAARYNEDIECMAMVVAASPFVARLEVTL